MTKTITYKVEDDGRVSQPEILHDTTRWILACPVERPFDNSTICTENNNTNRPIIPTALPPLLETGKSKKFDQ
jgi:hypothetical protein